MAAGGKAPEVKPLNLEQRTFNFQSQLSSSRTITVGLPSDRKRHQIETQTDKANIDGETPLSEALEMKNDRIADMLRARGARR